VPPATAPATAPTGPPSPEEIKADENLEKLAFGLDTSYIVLIVVFIAGVIAIKFFKKK